MRPKIQFKSMCVKKKTILCLFSLANWNPSLSRPHSINYRLAPRLLLLFIKQDSHTYAYSNSHIANGIQIFVPNNFSFSSFHLPCLRNWFRCAIVRSGAEARVTRGVGNPFTMGNNTSWIHHAHTRTHTPRHRYHKRMDRSRSLYMRCVYAWMHEEAKTKTTNK